MNTTDKDPMTEEPWMYKDEWLRAAAYSADIARGFEHEAIGLAWKQKSLMTAYGPACEAFARWVHSVTCALYALTPSTSSKQPRQSDVLLLLEDKISEIYSDTLDDLPVSEEAYRRLKEILKEL